MALPFFLVHSIPTEIWAGVRTRAHRERWALQALCLQLLEDYASGAVAPTTTNRRGGTQLAAIDPRVPLRTAVITLRNPRSEHRFQCVTVHEGGGNVVLFNHVPEPIARFLSSDVESWSLGDYTPFSRE